MDSSKSNDLNARSETVFSNEVKALRITIVPKRHQSVQIESELATAYSGAMGDSFSPMNFLIRIDPR